jgi:hypothetical protein
VLKFRVDHTFVGAGLTANSFGEEEKLAYGAALHRTVNPHFRVEDYQVNPSVVVHVDSVENVQQSVIVKSTVTLHSVQLGYPSHQNAYTKSKVLLLDAVSVTEDHKKNPKLPHEYGVLEQTNAPFDIILQSLSTDKTKTAISVEATIDPEFTVESIGEVDEDEADDSNSTNKISTLFLALLLGGGAFLFTIIAYSVYVFYNFGLSTTKNTFEGKDDPVITYADTYADHNDDHLVIPLDELPPLERPAFSVN